jgi:hypothetical protein
VRGFWLSVIVHKARFDRRSVAAPGCTGETEKCYQSKQ